jgi:hypothetical protein
MDTATAAKTLMDQHASDVNQDLQLGHITPKTISDLMYKDNEGQPLGTFEKCRNIFGMMLSGIGSGLAHQPNLYAQMMQKQIDNDILAQQNSKENATNLYRLHLQQQLQAMQQPEIAARAELATQQALVQPSIGKANEAAARASLASAGLTDGQLRQLNFTNTSNTVKAAVLKDIVDRASGASTTGVMTPEGQKNAANALQQAQVLAPLMINSAQDQNSASAAMIGLAGMVGGQGQPATTQTQSKQPIDTKKPSGPSDNVNYGKLRVLASLGQPGPNGQPASPMGMTPAQEASAREEGGALDTMRAARREFVDSFNNMDQMPAAGLVDPRQRAAQTAGLMPLLTRLTAGGYDSGEAENLLNLLPQKTDEGGSGGDTRKVKFQKAMQLFNTLEAKNPTLRDFKLINPPPDYKVTAPSGSSSGGETRKDASGKTWTKAEWDAAHAKTGKQ